MTALYEPNEGAAPGRRTVGVLDVFPTGGSMIVAGRRRTRARAPDEGPRDSETIAGKQREP